MKPLLIVTIFLSVLTQFVTGQSRGVWFWGSTTLPGGGSSPYGSVALVGDAVAEDETVAFFTTYGVKMVYGSYQNRPVSEPAVIAAWNAKLDAAGVSSQLLLDGNAVNDPAFMSSLLDKVSNRLINFNNSLADEAEKFDALHLDLEPQGLALWDGGTPAVKRALLDDLLTAYQDVRAHLDTAGFTGMPIYADIPFFWDKLPVDGGSVGWLTAADRDVWYGDVAAVLDGVSIMTFSKDNFASLDAAIDYERTTGMPGEARVGIQPKVGPSELWLNIGEFNTVMWEAEAAYGDAGATDIENYGFWRHAIATSGILPAIAEVVEVAPDPTTGGGVVIIHGVPGHLYIVRQSSDLNDWEEFSRVRVQVAGDTRIPFKADRPSKFFQVEVIADR
ncbi:hypothetical protein N9A94_08485 [Akkermansiaceae bacterium]|nr:hypothetical protein [Akkermansiaceae bacterium]